MKRRQSDQIRLESWKAIANYLHRSVRTARRWEMNEQLPVYRQQHMKGASVFAYASELDAWQREHQKVFPQAPENPPADREKWSFADVGRNAAIVFTTFVAGIVVGTNLANGPAPGIDSPLVSTSASHDDVLILPLAQLDDREYWLEGVAQVAAMPALLAWTEGRIQDALNESHKIRSRLPGFPAETRSHVIDHLINVSLAMGRVDDARNIAAAEEDSDRRYELQVQILFAAGDKEGMRAHLENGTEFKNESTGLFMAMVGLADDAIEFDSSLESAEAGTGRSNVILAMAAMGAGNKQEAKARLRAAASELSAADLNYYFVAVDMLAGMLNSEGRLVDAIAVLENTTPELDVAVYNKSGLFWLMCQRQLAVLYRQAERESDAEKIESALRDRLMLADENFPLARSLTDA